MPLGTTAASAVRILARLHVIAANQRLCAAVTAAAPHATTSTFRQSDDCQRTIANADLLRADPHDPTATILGNSILHSPAQSAWLFCGSIDVTPMIDQPAIVASAPSSVSVPAFDQ